MQTVLHIYDTLWKCFQNDHRKKKSTDGKDVNEDKNFLLYAKEFSKLASQVLELMKQT